MKASWGCDNLKTQVVGKPSPIKNRCLEWENAEGEETSREELLIDVW
jgi:hypothetical protein